MKSPVIIGIVGLPGAGKTTAAKYLESIGFQRVTLSDFIKEELKRRKLVPIREELQNVGNELRELHGPQILAQLAMKKIRQTRVKKVVIDGIRNLYEVAFLAVENNFTLVGIDAKPVLRYKRLVARARAGEMPDYKSFLREEKREDTLGSKEIGLRVRACLKKAHYIVRNEKGTLELERALRAIVTSAPLAKRI